MVFYWRAALVCAYALIAGASIGVCEFLIMKLYPPAISAISLIVVAICFTEIMEKQLLEARFKANDSKR